MVIRCWSGRLKLLPFPLLLILLLAGCQSVIRPKLAPEPTATATWPAPATPTATIAPPATIPIPASPTPTWPKPTPFPTPTVTPGPELGYYYDPLIGFSFSYPSDWQIGSETNVIIQNQQPRIVVAGRSNLLDVDETPEQYVSQFYGWLAEPNQVEQTALRTTLLWDGSEAQVIEFATADSFYKARATVTTRGRRVFMVLILAPQRSFEALPATLNAVAASMHIEPPRPFGISRDKAMVMAGGQPHTLDPILTHGSAGERIGQIFSGLVTLDQNMQVIPDLAERWTVSDAGTVYTFYLRPNAQFHDGKAVTAHDVKFSWERAADPAHESDTVETYLGDIVGVKAKVQGQASEIAGVQVIDDHTLQVTIDAPKAYFLAKLTYPTSFIVDEANVQLADWQHQPNGTGPFRLVTWRDDEVFILERNPNFYLEPPLLEHIVYLMQPDVAMWMYENDEIDLTGVGVDNIERVTDPTDSLSRDLHIVPSLCTSRLVFNLAAPPFDDPLVRRAFAQAIDRQKIAKLVFKGMVGPAQSILPPGMPGYSPNHQLPRFDPAEARRLLQDSTYGGSAGLPPVSFTVGGRGSAVSNFEAALIEMWRSHLGVEVVVEQLDPLEYLAEIRDRPRQLVAAGWCADYPDPENFLDILYHSASRENVGRYHNPAIDGRLEQARIEQEPQRRLALYQAIEAQLIADTPDILLYHSQNHFLLKPYVKNYLFTPTSLALNWRVVTIEPADSGQ
jgi:ABC-type transport system substrate-binding protein